MTSGLHGDALEDGRQRLTIDRLAPGEEARLRAIRLRSLEEAPYAFATTYEDAAASSVERWTGQLEQLATFVATVHGIDVGMVRGARHGQFGDIGYLISMWVAPEARRQGIGSALVDAVVAWAKAEGFARLLLDVGAENTPAIAFYRRKGFVPTEQVDALPPPREHIREIQLGLAL